MEGNLTTKGKKSFSFSNLKFVYKIQLGFLLIAIISFGVALHDYVRMNQIETAKDNLFTEYISESNQIKQVYSDFQKIQFLMLKFSMPDFASNFQSDVKKLNELRNKIDESFDSISKSMKEGSDTTLITEIKKVWLHYKMVVTDAIVSAAAARNYEFAAVISTTSGEEVGATLVEKFDTILSDLEQKGLSFRDDVTENIQTSQFWIIAGLIGAAAIVLLAALVLAPALSKPIEVFKKALDDFARGDFEANVEVNSGDEFGELAEALHKLKTAQIEKVNAAKEIARGSLIKVEAKSDKDALSQAFNEEVESLQALLDEAQKLIEANHEGDLNVRGNIERFSGGWRRFIEGINSILEASIKPINDAGTVLEKMAGGDFTRKITNEYKGDYQLVINNVNQVVSSLNEVIGKVALSSSELANAAAEISSGTEQMAAGASEQSMQTSEVASSIEEMSKTVLESTAYANDAAKSAADAREKAQEGGRIVGETIAGINRIAEVVLKSAGTIKTLGENSAQIGEIIQVIDDIADQTNLLALNAAIEAARAGEQGRGFAVVADEVRKLAERTTKATEEIASMIKKIQRDTEGAVVSIDEGTKEVERGKELAGNAEAALREIIAHSDEVSQIIGRVAQAGEMQAETSEQISKNVENINNIVHQSAGSTQQISRSAEDLYRLTERLQSLIGHFKLDYPGIHTNGHKDKKLIESDIGNKFLHA